MADRTVEDAIAKSNATIVDFSDNLCWNGACNVVDPSESPLMFSSNEFTHAYAATYLNVVDQVGADAAVHVESAELPLDEALNSSKGSTASWTPDLGYTPLTNAPPLPHWTATDVVLNVRVQHEYKALMEMFLWARPKVQQYIHVGGKSTDELDAPHAAASRCTVTSATTSAQGISSRSWQSFKPKWAGCTTVELRCMWPRSTPSNIQR
ncbi:hypothetical protein H257_15667 [Aphanomyces astaci]|uniref:Uncharacterized protein n=1 Tax=Aphanomyces astaci TaxID=112090 RepID=W4FNC3_APHAT|nr:hypothetical protein H257_15667 [Aphanomyces astaci]ETV68344.1 hypothetical protein H257_15667 [Aphanomyces astaci]|eukprot:XP_009842139.1 hypothetical protein H257_15667 [Aphanomyces astaci]